MFVDHVGFDVVVECAHAFSVRNEHFGERKCALSTASSTVLDGYYTSKQICRGHEGDKEMETRIVRTT